MDKNFKKMQLLAFGKTNKQNINESELKDKIKELVIKSLDEAKSKKEKKDDVSDIVDAAPQNTSIDMEASDTIAPEHSKETDINPTVKSIQDSLQKAFAGAKSLGDAKLVTQIGNTITMLVRDQVLGGGQQAVAENKGK